MNYRHALIANKGVHLDAGKTIISKKEHAGHQVIKSASSNTRNHDSVGFQGCRMQESKFKVGFVLVFGVTNEFNASSLSPQIALSRDRVEVTESDINRETHLIGSVDTRVCSNH
jgi:hypothetical protein